MGIDRGVRAVFLDRDGVINRALVHDGKPYPPQSKAHPLPRHYFVNRNVSTDWQVSVNLTPDLRLRVLAV